MCLEKIANKIINSKKAIFAAKGFVITDSYIIFNKNTKTINLMIVNLLRFLMAIDSIKKESKNQAIMLPQYPKSKKIGIITQPTLDAYTV